MTKAIKILKEQGIGKAIGIIFVELSTYYDYIDLSNNFAAKVDESILNEPSVFAWFSVGLNSTKSYKTITPEERKMKLLDNGIRLSFFDLKYEKDLRIKLDKEEITKIFNELSKYYSDEQTRLILNEEFLEQLHNVYYPERVQELTVDFLNTDQEDDLLWRLEKLSAEQRRHILLRSGIRCNLFKLIKLPRNTFVDADMTGEIREYQQGNLVGTLKRVD